MKSVKLIGLATFLAVEIATALVWLLAATGTHSLAQATSDQRDTRSLGLRLPADGGTRFLNETGRGRTWVLCFTHVRLRLVDWGNIAGQWKGAVQCYF